MASRHVNKPLLKILITDRNGLIGTRCFEKLSDEFSIQRISVRKHNPLELALMDYDVVLHSAALVHQMKKTGKKEYLRSNTYLTRDLAAEAKRQGVKQFIFLSTVKVYGEMNTLLTPWKEDSPCYPSGPYAESKYLAEKEVEKLASEGFTVSVIRIPLVYGPGVKGNIEKLIRFVKKSPLIPFKDIHNARSMVYIDNLVAFIERVILLNKPGIYLPTDGQPYSTTQVVEEIIHAMDPEKKNLYFPYWMQKLIKLVVPSYYDRLFGTLVINNSSSVKILNYKPEVTLAEGMSETVRYFL